jgi:lysylphosphatidylglycerol synthetase-like protein (DUF2156 family)
VGLVSYAWITTFTGRSSFVVTDPLAAPGTLKTLLEAYHRDVPGLKQYLGITESTAAVLREMGFHTNIFANDYYADLRSWKLTRKSSLQRYFKQGQNEGLVVREQTWDEVNADSVREISKKWLSTKSGNLGTELQLMTWPFYEGDEWASRKFYCYTKEGVMIAYIFFIPCFRDGKVRAGREATETKKVDSRMSLSSLFR